MTLKEFAMYSLIANIVVGLLFGVIILVIGMKNGKTKLGLGGLAASLAGGSIAGLFLSIPILILFWYLIKRKPKSDATTDIEADALEVPEEESDSKL